MNQDYQQITGLILMSLLAIFAGSFAVYSIEKKAKEENKKLK